MWSCVPTKGALMLLLGMTKVIASEGERICQKRKKYILIAALVLVLILCIVIAVILAPDLGNTPEAAPSDGATQSRDSAAGSANRLSLQECPGRDLRSRPKQSPQSRLKPKIQSRPRRIPRNRQGRRPRSHPGRAVRSPLKRSPRSHPGHNPRNRLRRILRLSLRERSSNC